uniref:Ring finger domain containing protein n=1 Tax=Babesia bovis TaxID=5865 RepID=S6C888_BABBO|nr:ring finger domain containing protein [Babesia bovis]
MVQFDVPSCSVCYEYLTSDLCAITTCGHVYHKQCITQWTKKSYVPLAKCPLCRCKILANGIVELKLECGEIRGNINHSDAGHAESEEISREIEDLKHKLAQAASDNLDIRGRFVDLQNENTSLGESLIIERDKNEILQNKNEELALEVAANNTTIAKLTEALAKHKSRLKKLEDVNNYLKAEDVSVDGFSSYLKTLTPNEKMTMLTNRVSELQGINNTLTQLRDFWQKKCDKLNRDYMILQREYKTLMKRQAVTQQYGPDPLNDSTNSDSNNKETEMDAFGSRKVKRVINFGLKSASDKPLQSTRVLVHRTPPSNFLMDLTPMFSEAPKVKPQKISDFFKSH